VAIVTWQLVIGKIAAIVLIVPIVGGFWTAMRGIAFFKRPQSPRSTGTAEQ
jgi:NO-binding membrane sensor protein with MHYT domain